MDSSSDRETQRVLQGNPLRKQTRLAVGMRVIFSVKYVDPSTGVKVNKGTFGQALDFDGTHDYVSVRIFMRDSASNFDLVVSRVRIETDGDVVFRSWRSALPIEPAEALTVSRVQGLEVETAIFILHHAWEVGQVNVGLGRVASLMKSFIIGSDKRTAARDHILNIWDCVKENPDGKMCEKYFGFAAPQVVPMQGA